MNAPIHSENNLRPIATVSAFTARERTQAWGIAGATRAPDETTEHWATRAGFDYEVLRDPVFFPCRTAKNIALGGRVMSKYANRDTLYHSVTGKPFEVVSSRYEIVQPRDILSLHSEIVSAIDLVVDTGGVVDDGAKIWTRTPLRRDIDLGDGDVTTTHLLAVTSFDKTSATNFFVLAERIWCLNQLALVYAKTGGPLLSIRHTQRFSMARLQRALDEAYPCVDEFESTMQKLAAAPINDAQARQFFIDLYHTDDEGNSLNPTPTSRQKQAQERMADELMNRYHHSPGSHLPSASNTLWGVVNAITNYIDRGGRKRSDAQRFNSAQFGHGKRIKQKAVERATAMC